MEGSTKAAVANGDAVIRLTRLEKAVINVPVIGITPVIPHKWSEKALRMMREKQSGSKARPRKDPKDPVEEAEGCTYYLPDGRPGIPATAFKAAIVGAARYFDGITLVQAREAFFVQGEGPDQLLPIEHPEDGRVLREDTPRVSGGTADLRYRYAYFPWRVVLAVRFNPVLIDANSVIAMVDAAGQGGVGDWRPSSPKSNTGTFGTFEVEE